MEGLKRVIAASLILALSVIIGLHLALFWSSDGQMVIGERNKVLWIIECVTAAGIFVFGIERLVVAVRTQLSRRKDIGDWRQDAYLLTSCSRTAREKVELQCPVCGRRFPSLEVLVQHLMLAHRKDRMEATEIAVRVWRQNDRS